MSVFIYCIFSSNQTNGNPLQYSCLENTMDGGAWWAAVYRVAQSQTRLKRLSSSSSKTVPDGPVVKNVHASARDARDTVSIPGLERSPGVGNGNPLQYSCLENPRDGGAWWAAVYRVAQSQTRLKRLSSSSSSTEEMRRRGLSAIILHLEDLSIDCSPPPSLRLYFSLFH